MTTSSKSSRTLFLAPAAVLMLVLSIFPLFYSFALTFSDMRIAAPEVNFVGLDNWKRLFSDARFGATLINTFVFVVVGVTAQFLLGLALAVLLHQEFRGRWFFRISFLLPMMMSPVAISFVIGKLLFSEGVGPVTHLTQALGMGPLLWSRSAFGSTSLLIAIDTWQWVPLFIVILLAGLQSIDGEVQEAARIDGASRWQTFRFVTLPLLMPLCTVIILIRSLEAFKIIDIIRVVTGGGPGSSTESITTYAYTMGIKNGEIGYATTMAYVLLIAMTFYAILFLKGARLLSRWKKADDEQREKPQ